MLAWIPKILYWWRQYNITKSLTSKQHSHHSPRSTNVIKNCFATYLWRYAKLLPSGMYLQSGEQLAAWAFHEGYQKHLQAFFLSPYWNCVFPRARLAPQPGCDEDGKKNVSPRDMRLTIKYLNSAPIADSISAKPFFELKQSKRSQCKNAHDLPETYHREYNQKRSLLWRGRKWINIFLQIDRNTTYTQRGCLEKWGDITRSQNSDLPLNGHDTNEPRTLYLALVSCRDRVHSSNDTPARRNVNASRKADATPFAYGVNIALPSDYKHVAMTPASAKTITRVQTHIFVYTILVKYVHKLKINMAVITENKQRNGGQWLLFLSTSKFLTHWSSVP